MSQRKGAQKGTNVPVPTRGAKKGMVKGLKRKASTSIDLPTKRAKTSEASLARLAASQKSLSMFVDMPMDVLTEIFTLLSPKDLVNLSRTSLMFCRTLCRKDSNIIWKTSRIRESGATPACPEDMSERDYAVLLFSTTCMHCGANNIKEADFFLRRRLCKGCKKANLVHIYSKTMYAHIDLIPQTNRSWTLSLSSKYLWKPEMEDMTRQIKSLEADVKRGQNGAKKALEGFKARRVEAIKRINASADELFIWQHCMTREQKQRTEEAVRDRLKEIERRFHDLGYLSKDFPRDMDKKKFMRQSAPLTDHAWNLIRESLEPELVVNKTKRLAVEFLAIQARRRNIVERLYAQYRIKLPSSQWESLPVLFNICRLEPIRKFIDADRSVTVTEADLAPCMNNLAETLSSAFEDAKTRLRDHILTRVTHGSVTQSEEFKELQLAMIILQCTSCRHFVFSFDELKMHACTPPDQGVSRTVAARYPTGTIQPDTEFPYTFTFRPDTVPILQQIIRAVGLDHATATAVQMDEKDARFRCRQCLEAENRDRSWYPETAYSWKAMTYHVISSHGGIMKTKEFLGFEEVPARYIPVIRRKEAEEAGRVDVWHRWACTRCTKYMIGAYGDMQEDVRKHVVKVHKIKKPQIGLHLAQLPCGSSGHYGTHYSPMDAETSK